MEIFMQVLIMFKDDAMIVGIVRLPSVLRLTCARINLNETTLQYYCTRCNNILKETYENICVSSMESCPFCGMVLSTTLQTRHTLPVQSRPKIVFQRASDIPKLTLDVPQIDSVLQFLTPGQKLSISGMHTQKIIERICVRAQLPHRYGGLDSHVLLVDGANSSDLYQCVDFARQYGLDADKILDGIISSRAFTIYQLADTIINELPKAIEQHGVKVVIITNLLHYFTDDAYLDANEIKPILKEIVKTLSDIKDCLVIVTFGMPTHHDYLFLKLFSRGIRIEDDNGSLCAHVDDNHKKTSLRIKQDELEIIPQH